MSKMSAVEAEKENVLICAGACSVTVMTQFGGKIASLQVGGRELLQTPLAPVAARTRTMAFDAADASGWDECLPSVAACTVPFDGAAQIPDHGDLWRVAWETLSSDADAATLRGECFSLPLVLERNLKLVEVEAGCAWNLEIHYKVTNTGYAPVPWSWAAHPLFACEPGDRIVLPESIKSLRLEGSGGGRLGKSGDLVGWPVAALMDGTSCALDVAQAPESGTGDKLFAGPLTGAENWCVLERPSAGVRIRVNFDPALTPYLGLWICYGGWPDGPGPKQNCIALEPATAPVDSLAQTGPWSRVLEAGKSYSWPMHLCIELI
jgi:galactose mutarotase-like enzyme